MKILFFDGKLSNIVPKLNNFSSEYIIIDAGDGVRKCIERLEEIRFGLNSDNAVVLTNYLGALSTQYATYYTKREFPFDVSIWQEDVQGFYNISRLTDREIKFGHRLDIMYLNGEFGRVGQFNIGEQK